MGVLYVVATPIGNLEDITLRALRILREARLVAAEDTRTTAKLFARHDIHTRMVSLYEHNELMRLDEVLGALQAGDVALVSEAGMPTISDPGYRLVRAAVDCGVSVVPVPGPSAVLAALAVSGLPTDSFLFIGFLPRRHAARRRKLTAIRTHPDTIVCFESPHRLVPALRDIEEAFGDREIAVACELTKLYEEVWRGTVRHAVAHYGAGKPRGEFTLVIAGSPDDEPPAWEEARVQNALARLVEEGTSRRDAASSVAQIAGWSKRRVYRLAAQYAKPERDEEESHA